LNSYDAIVIGGGIAGLSVASSLAHRLRVLVLEAESSLGYHSTGRSGAVFGRSYGNDVILKLNELSSAFFEAPPSNFTDGTLFRQRPWLIVARADQVEASTRWQKLATRLEVIRAKDIPEQSGGLLRPGYAEFGYLDRNCGDLDVHALNEGYRRLLLACGGQIVLNARVQAIERAGSRWNVETAAGCFSSPLVVNASGGWADSIAGMMGLDPIGIAPLRRSAALVRAPDGVDVARLPVILDADEQFYFKPEAGKLMISSADETPCVPCDVQAEEIDIAHAVDRYERATGQNVRRIDHHWAGMRTFAPDRTPVVGFDPRCEGLLWVAGQGGYGIQIAPALAQLAAGSVFGEPVDARLAAALDPARLIGAGAHSEDSPDRA